MAKKIGGAGKGQMTDVAFRSKQAELAQRKRGQEEYEAQTNKTEAGIQQGLNRVAGKVEADKAAETQNQQFQQTQQLNAAKADLEYDPETRTYKANAMGQQKAQVAQERAKTERMEVMSKVHQQEFDNMLALEKKKLELQKEGRYKEENYLKAEQAANAQIAKYDAALAEMQTGGKTPHLDAMFAEKGGREILASAKKGDPQAVEMVKNKLQNRVNYLALRASSITGAWPNLDPNSPTGIAWVEHHRGVDAQVRQMAQAYAMIGQPHPLSGMSTREQKRFVIEESARTFLPLFSMKTARMQNGAGTGSPTPGAGGVQSKYGDPNPGAPAGPQGPSAPASSPTSGPRGGSSDLTGVERGVQDISRRSSWSPR